MTNTRFDDYHAIIPHPTSTHILFLRNGDDSWTLPKATVPLFPDDGRWRDAFRINAAFKQVFGITITVLECLSVSPFPASGQHGNSVFAMSNHDSEWVLPQEGKWISYEEFEELSLIIPEHRTFIEYWFTQRDAPDPDALPWTHDGWFEEASIWMQTQLHLHGLVATGPIEQTRSWFISSLLRLPTSAGDVYFKAVPQIDVHEPLLTQMLASQYPTLVPQVLAIHEEKRWLLMKAVPGTKMPSNANPLDYLLRWQTLLRSYATMQRNYMLHVEHMLALGCHDWRLEVLAEVIAPFFAELPSLLHNSWHPLTEEELEALQNAIPYLKTLCTELAQLGIPPSLHHGDFHRGNIIVNETTCTLIDWAGFVGITHPFLSLWVPLSDWDQQLGQQLCDSYLEIWQDFASFEQLRSAVVLAHPLSALCGALGHCHQLKHIHTQLAWDILNEQENMLDCLRSVLTLIK